MNTVCPQFKAIGFVGSISRPLGRGLKVKSEKRAHRITCAPENGIAPPRC